MVQDVNGALATIATDFAGSADPAAFAGPYTTWADTANNLLKRRNPTNSGWVDLGPLFNPGRQYAQGEEPTSNVGDIWIEGIGPCAWDEATSRYWRIALWNNSVEFVSSGTFTTDAYTRRILISACGPGGAGGFAVATGSAGGGGAGAWVVRKEYAVTPSTDYAVAIGAPSTTVGGVTSFGSPAIVAFGPGQTGGELSSAGYTTGGAGGTSIDTGVSRGQAGSPASIYAPHGIGGSGPFGNGGVNWSASSTDTSIDATGYGSGGPGSFNTQGSRRLGKGGYMKVEF